MTRPPLPGIFLILAGILLALVPHILLPVCEGVVATASGGNVPMKCFWTAKAELGTGALTAFAGLLYCLSRNPGVRFGIAVMTAATGMLGMAFPTLLIGVCPSETMPCRMGTLPALVLINAAIVITALLACLSNRRAMSREGGRP